MGKMVNSRDNRIAMGKLSRRKFFHDGSRTVIAGALVGGQLHEEKKEMKNVFVHHVFFWLKSPGSQADLEKLLEGLKKLSSVKTIRNFHIGKPAATKREVIDTSYDVSWLVLFATKEDQDSYQADPVHLRFVEECSSLWSKVVVYDSIDG